MTIKLINTIAIIILIFTFTWYNIMLIWIALGLWEVLCCLIHDRKLYGKNYKAFNSKFEYLFISCVIIVMWPITIFMEKN